jgi:hypothetical protein
MTPGVEHDNPLDIRFTQDPLKEKRLQDCRARLGHPSAA